ncbi:MAG TPA: class I tRNA ligase family protein [Polyangiaceae bacterium]|nr:class I tRNA ligase family protein [Polyangiaceae bacterium]
MEKWLITATPPTTNGDLHVGHLSGPYLAGDVFARRRRALGDDVLYCSGGDDSQTYVVTTAGRLGTTPAALAAESNAQIRATLAAAGVTMDAYTAPDAAYAREVQAFFARLYAAGKLRRRRQAFAYDEAEGRFLFEAYVQGYCPECYAATCGAICEGCGHPNDGASLLDARRGGGGGGGPVARREAETLALPLEDYRAAIEAFYARAGAGMRPHVLRFVDQMLERPLPDFPVSYPSDWGVPVAIDGFEGQVYNPWAEMYPALGHMARAAARARGAGDDPWAEGGRRLVQFLGFDNTFYFSLAHLALALAAPGAPRPDAIVTNEFYYLDGQKFSTSRRHLIWARELVDKYGADNVRFFLARQAPETQVANFVEGAFRQAVRAELHEPLRRLGARLGDGRAAPRALDEGAHRRFERFARRAERAYALETFSPREAAEAAANLLAYLADVADADADAPAAELGLSYFCAHAHPLVPALAERLWAALGHAGEPRPDSARRLGALPARGRLEVGPLLRQW